MTGLLCNTQETLEIMLDDLDELVRGQEREFLERITPMVRTQDVLLDLSHVERIDAAGIAALITVYGVAGCEGHRFNVFNTSPRVAEVLALVGLDRILIRPCAVPGSYPEPRFSRPAA
jgi:anti-anti-sigma factor